MSDRTILLTGATGLLGRRLLARLLRSDPRLRVAVLVRNPPAWRAAAASSVARERARVHAVRGDLTLPGLWLDLRDRRSLENLGPRTVIHCAADTSFSQSLEHGRAVNRDGTRRLLELAGELGTVERFVHLSTAYVAGRRTGIIREEPYGPEVGWVNAYERSKYEAEEVVRAGVIPWTIVRPSTVVCDDLGGAVSQVNAVHRALRLFHAGLAPMMPGAEDTPVDLVTTEFVVEALARLAFEPGVEGRAFHLCAGDGTMALGELLDRARHVWARDPIWRSRGVERPALTDLGTYRLFERSVEETGDARLRAITRSLAHFVPQLALPKHFDTRAAEGLLGFAAPRVASFWDAAVVCLVSGGWTGRARRAG